MLFNNHTDLMSYLLVDNRYESITTWPLIVTVSLSCNNDDYTPQLLVFQVNHADDLSLLQYICETARKVGMVSQTLSVEF